MKFAKRTWNLNWEKNKHPENLSRRDVLDWGLKSGLLFSIPTGLSQLFLPKKAMAAAGFGNLYVAQLDLRFGYAGHGQFLPNTTSALTSGGLTTLGVTSSRLSAPNSLDTRLGLPFFGTGSATLANDVTNAAQYTSKVMGGIMQRAGAALPNTRAAAIMIRSSDDSGFVNNSLGMGSAFLKAGLSGAKAGHFAMVNSQSGIFEAELLTGSKPSFASSVVDIENAVKIGGLAHLPNNAALELMKGVQSLSQNDLAKLGTSEQGLRSLVANTISKNQEMVVAPPGLDARQDPDALTAFGFAATASPTDPNVIMASLLSGMFRDYFGTVSLQLGDYDYHNRPLLNANGTLNPNGGEARDLEAGIVIGNILRYAAIKGKELLLLVTSAGSVGGGATSATDPVAPRSWNGDRGENSTITLYYHKPGSAPTQVKTQVGFFLPAGGTSVDANPNDPIQGNQIRGAAAAVSNALMLAGKANMIDVLFPGMFTTAEKEQIRLFG